MKTKFMSGIVETLCWRTADGKVFDKESEAIKHQLKCNIAENVAGWDVYWREPDFDSVVSGLILNRHFLLDMLTQYIAAEEQNT